MPTVNEMKSAAFSAIESRKSEIIEIAQTILKNPETGFSEFKTSQLVQEKMGSLGIPFQKDLAITGIKGVVNGGAGAGPSVAVIGELDSLRIWEHPFHDNETGAAHACGHHCQIANMIGTMIGLLEPTVLSHLSGTIIPMAVPAEEFIDVERRMRLRDEGKIEFMGGKQELIKLGVFDEVDMAMMCHTDPEGFKLAIGGSSNGHIVKFVQFSGQSAHAGGAPHKGVNALNAAVLALSAINANRETFRDEDTVRVHGILTSGGEAVSAIPANVTLEWRVRSSSLEALLINSEKVDRCFKAGALAVGADVQITNIPGYMPMKNDPIMQDIFLNNARTLIQEDELLIRPPSLVRGGSTDMGDLAQIIPLIHPYCGGASGTAHSDNYLIDDYEAAVINPAKAMAASVIDLLAENGSKAKEVKQKSRPDMSKSQYLNFQRSRAEIIRFEGKAI